MTNYKCFYLLLCKTNYIITGNGTLGGLYWRKAFSKHTS